MATNKAINNYGVSSFATGDSGGTLGNIHFTNTSDLSANSTGTFTIKSKSVNNLDSTGFIKIYIGTDAYYIPVFSTTAP